MKNNIIDSLATKIYEMELHKEEAHHLKMKFKRK